MLLDFMFILKLIVALERGNFIRQMKCYSVIMILEKLFETGKNVYSDNMAVLENEKDAGQRYSELLDEFKKKIESSDIEGAKKGVCRFLCR